MANYNKMTDSKYKAIKILLNGGASVKEAAEYMKVSTAVVYAVKNSETFEEYIANNAEREARRKQVAAMKAKQAKAQKVAEQVGATPAANLIAQEQPTVQKVVHEQRVTIQATHYMMQELQKTNELLAGISRKLATIVEDLYGTKEG